MSKNLNLNDLKIQSFVTSLDNDEKARVKGGYKYTCLTCDHYDCSGSVYVVCS